MRLLCYLIGTAMEFLLYAVVSFGLLAGVCKLARAQCPGGRCSAPIVQNFHPTGPAVEWRFRDDAPGQSYLYVNGVQVGGLKADGTWLPLAGDQWGSPLFLFNLGHSPVAKSDCSCKNCSCSPCLCASPERLTRMPRVKVNYGMDWRPTENQAERWSINGKEIRYEPTVEEGSEDPSLPDDSGTPVVTVIGTAEARAPVLKDLAGNLAELKKGFRVNSYAPDHWAAVPFKATGNPTISFEDAKGKEVSRMNDYTNGADRMGKTLQKLRNPDPNFDPTKTPDLSKPAAPNVPLESVPAGGVLTGVLGLVALLLPSRKAVI